MAEGIGGIQAMLSQSIAQSGLRIEEVVLLVYVQSLVGIMGIFCLDKLIVDTICLVADMAVLQVGKGFQSFGQGEGAFQISTVVSFVGVRVIIGIGLSVIHVMIAQILVGDIGKFSEMVAGKLLQGDAAQEVQTMAFVVGIP